METIRLKQVTLEARADLIYIKHNATGMVTEVSKEILDRWALSKLRNELTVKPGVDAK